MESGQWNLDNIPDICGSPAPQRFPKSIYRTSQESREMVNSNMEVLHMEFTCIETVKINIVLKIRSHIGKE